jgi:hypothetical protein
MMYSENRLPFFGVCSGTHWGRLVAEARDRYLPVRKDDILSALAR